MSYINKLDLLFEANEGPSRRDFNKSVLGTALSTAMPININASPVSAGVKALKTMGSEQITSFPLIGNLINKCLSELPLIKQISMIPLKAREIVLNKNFASENHYWFPYTLQDKDRTGDELKQMLQKRKESGQNPIIKAFKSGLIGVNGAIRPDHSNEPTPFISHLFGVKDMYDGSDGFTDNQIAPMLDLLVKKAGGTDAFAKLYLSDITSYDCFTGAPTKAEKIINGIAVFEKLCRSQPLLQHMLKNFAGKSIKEKVKTCHEKGFINDEDIAAVKKEETQEKKEIEEKKDEDLPKSNDRSDDEAIGRWEDEGGAVGPLDEAIRRLLNVIY